jgi:hypothetical protein
MINDGTVHPTKEICKTAMFPSPLECCYWFHIYYYYYWYKKKIKNKKQRKYPEGYNINTHFVDVLPISNYEIAHNYNGGRRWRIWLRHCVTRRKVADSIPDKIIAIIYIYHPSGRSMVLRSTHPLREMSTRYFNCGVKEAGAYGWQTYHLSVPIVLKSGSLDLLEQSERVQALMGLLYFYFLHLPKNNKRRTWQ